jgi:hypothetical protein
MKAITVKQPWASLIIEGIKDIENRTWKCPQKYIGQRVLIHAGADYSLLKTYPTGLFTQNQWKKINENESFAMEFTAAYWMWYSWKNINPFFPLSVIIGSVEIVGCVINHPSIWAEKTKTFSGLYMEKPIYNGVLANPIKFPKPIPCKGKLSFWDYNGILP